MRKLIIIYFLSIAVISNAQTPDFQWVRQVGGITAVTPDAMASDAQGNTYTAGRFTHTTDFDPGPGIYNLSAPYPNQNNIFILKLDGSGNFVWVKGFTGNASGQIKSITIDALNNVYTTGNFNGQIDFDPGVGTFTFSTASNFISKLDASGNFVWAKNFGTDVANFAINSIAVDASSSVYATGEFQNPSDFDPGSGTFTLSPTNFQDVYVLKLDNLGNFSWVKRFECQQVGVGYSLKINSVNNIYIAGAFQGETDFDPDNVNTFTLNSVGARDVFISKLDASGNFIWVKSLGGAGQEEPYSIAFDAANNIYTSGYFIGSPDFDPGPSVYTLSTTSRDVFISKLDASGNFIWAKSFLDSPLNTLNVNDHPAEVDQSGNVYTIGTFSSIVDFDPSSSTFNLTSNGQEDVFILKLDASGNFVGAKQLGGPGTDVSRALAIDSYGNLFTTGYFSGTSDFDPGSGVYNLTSVTSDVFVHKMDQLAMSISENSDPFKAIIYPNPTKDILNIKLDNHAGENIQIEISNISGQVISKEKMNSDHSQIIIKNLTAGFYFLNLLNDNKIIATKKIVKE